MQERAATRSKNYLAGVIFAFLRKLLRALKAITSTLTGISTQYYNKAKMASDKIFINALIASVILHVFLFVPMPHISKILQVQTPEEIELNYRPEPKKIPIDSKLIAEKPTEKPVIPVKAEKPQEKPVSAAQPVSPAPLEKIQTHEKITPSVSPVIKADLPIPSFSDDSILIADDKKDLSSEPVYLDYYNAVRSQIYKSAQANKPYYFMEGGVSLVFTLSRTGRLINAGIIQERSTRNPILQKHALSSIERAAPFSPFHESMKEQELTLRITISFEK
jgi:TonB family protein